MSDNTITPVDGAVYAYQTSPHEGLVYTTIAGPDGGDPPMCVGFDLADLDALAAARDDLRHQIGQLRNPGGATVLDLSQKLNQASEPW